MDRRRLGGWGARLHPRGHAHGLDRSISPEDAFAKLVAASQSGNVKSRALAIALVEAVEGGARSISATRTARRSPARSRGMP